MQTVKEIKRFAQIKTFHELEDDEDFDFHHELTEEQDYQYPILRFICYACQELLNS